MEKFKQKNSSPESLIETENKLVNEQSKAQSDTEVATQSHKAEKLMNQQKDKQKINQIRKDLGTSQLEKSEEVTLEDWEKKLGPKEKFLYDRALKTAQRISYITNRLPSKGQEVGSAGALGNIPKDGKMGVQRYFEAYIGNILKGQYYRGDDYGELFLLNEELDFARNDLKHFLKRHPEYAKDGDMDFLEQERIGTGHTPELDELSKLSKQEETPGQNILEKFNLKVGDKIKLRKEGVLAGGNSGVQSGTIIEGILLNDIKAGQPISLSGGANTSAITAVREYEGKLQFKTKTSVYELVTEETNSNSQEKVNILTKTEYQKERDAYEERHRGEKVEAGDAFKSIPVHDDPGELVLRNNGFKEGDDVLFFDDGKERQGTLKKYSTGELRIIDKKNNPWPVVGVLGSPDGYIKKV